MAALILLHFGLAIVAVFLRPLRRGVFAVCAIAPLATFAWAVYRAPAVLGGEVFTETVSWVPSLGLDFSFRLDGLALLMVVLVSGIGTLVFGYAISYFGQKSDLARFAALLTAFAGAMLGLVLSNNLLCLVVFWELTSITSYLLIGTEDTKPAARAAALQALLITGLGGLCMLAGFVLIGLSAGTFSMSEILANPPPGGDVVTAALILVLIGAFTKSAQFPFHSWLPGAMQAPTPVSAYLHSATMVKAGIYLIARFSPAFADVGVWRPLVITVGVVTMAYGAYRALYQRDLKLLLAYGTISQLGFMVILFGAGTPYAIQAGVAVLLAHAIFKASLFMVVGVIDHQTHTRDIRALSGLWKIMPVAFGTAVLAAASMAAIPPLFGFISKELGYTALLDIGTSWGYVVFACVFLSSVLTFAYSARFVWGGFARKRNTDFRADYSTAIDVSEIIDSPRRPRVRFIVPAALLGLAALVLGIWPAPASWLVAAATSALDPVIDPKTLHLWPGINLALIMSLATIVLGAAMFAARRRIENRHRRRLPDLANDAYQGLVSGLASGSVAFTARIQSGSLPTYLLVILWVVILVPGIAAAAAIEWPRDAFFASTPFQIVVGLLVVAAAVGTVRARRRFAAVIFTAAMGYGVALLFVIQGAPDLALTQFLVDTVAVVAYVLVLRHLPANFAPAPFRRDRAIRLVTAILVGCFVLLFALTIGAPSSDPAGKYYEEHALEEADGRNVVNVILVDFRAFDTLGEITVLLVAGIGVASLLVAGRKYIAKDAETRHRAEQARELDVKSEVR